MAKMDHGLCGGADFCHEIEGDRDVTFQHVYGGVPPSRRILTTNSFMLIVDLSPLTSGHILILTRKHYFSFAHAINWHEKELRDTMDWLLPHYQNTFGPPVILEHGSTPNDNHNSCITHAHWHVFPLDGRRVDDAMQADGLIRESLADLSQLSGPSWIEVSYFLSFHSEGLGVYKPLPGMPRQYIRSVVGRLLGMRDPEWDYAVFIRKELLRLTVAMAGDWPKPSIDIVNGES